ncbi:MAG: DUF72 domain-containing protein [Chloroflexota bacterium]|nr:DUF72 domain-containing protein [Chloroflexota bacterium]
MPVVIGTSGWQYRHWRDRFYRGVPQKRWLEHYAGRFETVESNNAFYRLPDRSTFEAWAARTPDDFTMAVKVSRYLTHVKRLADPAEPVQRFVERATGLGVKLGPALLQLPPTMRADISRLVDTLDRFPDGMRVALEVRHPSWDSDAVRTLLAERSVALCLADRRGALQPLWRTADWGYIRFHDGRAHPPPCYGRAALQTWAERIAETWTPGADVFVYFNNDPQGCAIRDARLFARAVARAGLHATRVPRPSETPVG